MNETFNERYIQFDVKVFQKLQMIRAVCVTYIDLTLTSFLIYF